MRLRIGLGLFTLLSAGCSSDPAPGSREDLPSVTLAEVRSSLDGMSLTWFSSKPVTQFSLERQNADSGRWILVADAIPASSTGYVDRSLDPGGKLRYRLSASVEGGGRVSAETPNPVDGPTPWTFEFRGALRSTDASKGMVFIRIQKFEKGIGKVEASRIHFERELIGWWEEKSGAGPVSRHRVTLAGGKSVEVDFDTGARLINVEPKTTVVEVKRCKPVFKVPGGEKIDCVLMVEKRPYQHHVISWFDDRSGMHLVNVPEQHPLNQLLCEDHRPKPEEEPRLREARLLLDRADGLWERDADASIRLYQRLLKEYKDIVIRLQVRNRVEGRARQADEN